VDGAACRRPVAWTLAALLFVLAAFVGAPGASAATPDKDSFYAPPSSLPAKPGDLIRYRSAKFTLDPLFKLPVAGVKSFQVLYRSTTALGQPVAVSGTVLVPTSKWSGKGPRPVVTYGVGTRGIGDQCAPSYTLSNGTDYEGLFIYSALKKGWVVLVSDMRGLGTPGLHTYEVGREQGMALLDIVRAARQVPGSEVKADSPIGIMGYSQGGTSAGWAAQLAPVYAPELKIQGISAGGVPADLTDVAEYLDGGLFVGFALMAAVGYDAAYPELNLQAYMNQRGKDLLKRGQSMCLVDVASFPTLISTLFRKFTDYTTTNPLYTPAWQARLNENRLGSMKPPAPVFQYHGKIDEIIPLGQARDLRKEWCALGANVTYTEYSLSEHLLGMIVGAPDAINFLSDRFAGKTVRGNC